METKQVMKKFDGLVDNLKKWVNTNPLDMVGKQEKECRYGHICNSSCMKDIECPCQDSHCCAMSENCEGECDDCFRPDLADKVNDEINDR